MIVKYGGAFSAGYEETFAPARALEDIGRIERLGPDRPMAIDLYREMDAPETCLRVAIYRFDAPMRLSERVPVLENLGFSVIDERSYRVIPHFESGKREVVLHDMVLESADGSPLERSAYPRIEDCFLAVFRGEAENDGFNRLVITAGAAWREVAALRAYAAFLRQLGSPFGLRYIADTLQPTCRCGARSARAVPRALQSRQPILQRCPQGCGGAYPRAYRRRARQCAEPG